MLKKIILSDFNGTDMEKLEQAAAFLRKNPGSNLIIPAGEYNITTPLAQNVMQEVIAGIHGDPPQDYMFNPNYVYSKGFDLSGINGAQIDAVGAIFMVNGFMEPVSIKESNDIIIKGLTIDHKRKPYSKGIITEAVIEDSTTGKGYITVAFGKEYPLKSGFPMPRHAIYDEFSSRYIDYSGYSISERVMTGENTFRMYGNGLKQYYVDKEFYGWHTFHSRPAILIEDSTNITLKNVMINSQPGMGIVAHRSENLEFDSLRVIPSAGEHVSTNTDATHITSCKGYLKYIGCEFEGQGDDSLNVHTYYHTIVNHTDNKCTLKVNAPTGTHSQTLDYPDTGDVLELTDIATLGVIDTYRVTESFPDNDNMTVDVILDKDLPKNCEKYFFADATRCPELLFTNCILHNHIARGVLVKTKKATITNNVFIDIVSTAIEIAAESWWHEGLCSTESIVIQGNHIINCARNPNNSINGSGGIAVTVSCEKPEDKNHADVLIENNIIDCPQSPYGIYVANTKKFTIRGNQVKCASDIPIKIIE